MSRQASPLQADETLKRREGGVAKTESLARAASIGRREPADRRVGELPKKKKLAV